MEPMVERPNILHLQNVTLDNVVSIEDAFDKKILEEAKVNDNAPEHLPYDKIPTVFTDLENWPISTNLRCWSCVFTFDSRPCFIPKKIKSEGDNSIKMEVLGNFCTFNCAARYIDDNFPQKAFSQKHSHMHNNLRLIYHKFTGHRVTQIKPAPSKIELLEFGGTLSKDEFWKQLRILDSKYGLRDHRPGTVIPERLRPPLIGPSMWDICCDDCNDKETNDTDSALNDLLVELLSEWED